MIDSQSWQDLAQAKRDALKNSIPKNWRLEQVPSPEHLQNGVEFVESNLSPEERQITELPLEVLRPALQAGLVSSKEVTLAFAHRAALAHQLTNCLTEFILEDALRRADELDIYLKETGRPVGPLHGVPVSLKDLFYLEGTDTTVGFAAWLNDKAMIQDEAGVVKILRNAGAVFFVKTNVPTSMMCAETVNNVFGFTNNAINRFCSAAGSSGGEGSLLALRGSPLGIGSDIGGSIRLPASVAGVWGLKVTPGRFPIIGTRSTDPGQVLIPSVVGPMANSLQALEICTKLLLSSQPWLVDPSVVELPWKNCDLPSNLVFGVMLNDGIVHPQPPIEQALTQVIDALERDGHEVLSFSPPSHFQALTLWLEIMTQCAGEQIHELIEKAGEPLIEEVAAIFGSKKGERSAISVAEAHEQAMELKAYRMEYERAWNETAQQSRCGRAMDGILLPNTGVVCWRRGGVTYQGYTPPANVLHFPSISMPLAKAEPVPQTHRQNFLSSIDEDVYHAYDPDMSRGMPVGIQLMGRRFQEEKLLVMAQAVESSCSRASLTRTKACL